VALTYAEVEARANRMAHLLAARGLGTGAFVGVVLPRSPELVPALLAVLKAGAAYVPVDPEYPVARIAHVLDDARPVLTLTTTDLAARLPGDAPRVL
ncbi:AMP-binding protein, partial [Saccharothrix sp. MB29]|nr:AMP-binding protein [Saccharothrix sp. MB29]